MSPMLCLLLLGGGALAAAAAFAALLCSCPPQIDACASVLSKNISEHSSCAEEMLSLAAAKESKKKLESVSIYDRAEKETKNYVRARPRLAPQPRELPISV
jgi:hypothetical protein